MLKLIRKARSWFQPKHKGPFEYSAEGFTKAKRWAKNQPHPYIKNQSLWSFVDSGWIDSEHKLHEINKVNAGIRNIDFILFFLVKINFLLGIESLLIKIDQLKFNC